jgi:hypothetical protein
MINLHLIEKFKKWKNAWTNKDSIGLFEYISFNVHPDDVLIIGKLFFPVFIEVEDCIFLETNINKRHLNEISSMNIVEKAQREKEINKVHLYDIFSHTDNVDEITFINVGKLLKSSWSTHLKNSYPHKEIIVDLIIDEKEYGPILIVYQKPKN